MMLQQTLNRAIPNETGASSSPENYTTRGHGASSGENLANTSSLVLPAPPWPQTEAPRALTGRQLWQVIQANSDVIMNWNSSTHEPTAAEKYTTLRLLSKAVNADLLSLQFNRGYAAQPGQTVFEAITHDGEPIRITNRNLGSVERDVPLASLMEGTRRQLALRALGLHPTMQPWRDLTFTESMNVTPNGPRATFVPHEELTREQRSGPGTVHTEIHIGNRIIGRMEFDNQSRTGGSIGYTENIRRFQLPMLPENR